MRRKAAIALAHLGARRADLIGGASSTACWKLLASSSGASLLLVVINIAGLCLLSVSNSVHKPSSHVVLHVELGVLGCERCHFLAVSGGLRHHVAQDFIGIGLRDVDGRAGCAKLRALCLGSSST